MNVLLWVIYPYVAIAVLVGGLLWRYRYDKFGWTTRSSQLYESAVLRWGSPMFHFGVLMVLVVYFLPAGIVPALTGWWQSRQVSAPAPEHVAAPQPSAGTVR